MTEEQLEKLCRVIVDAINAERRISKLETNTENQEKVLDEVKRDVTTLHSRISKGFTGVAERDRRFFWWLLSGFVTLAVIGIAYILRDLGAKI